MTRIIVSTPFYLGKKDGKPAFYPVGRGDAPEADLKSSFGLALEKGEYFTRVKSGKADSDAPEQDASAEAAKGSRKTSSKAASSKTASSKTAPEGGAADSDAGGQDPDADAAKESGGQ